MKKIKHIDDDRLSKSHRSGWKYVSHGLGELHTVYGTEFYTWADVVFSEGRSLSRPWTGVLHSPIKYPDNEYQCKYGKGIMCLEKLVVNQRFQKSLPSCMGLFSLSQVTKDFLNSRGVRCESLLHPCRTPSFCFNAADGDWGVVMIGQMMRRFHDFLDLQTDRAKSMLVVPGHQAEYEAMIEYSKSKQRPNMIDRLEDADYDQILKNNIVFLSLYDCSACNTVMECIMSGTPLLVNRLPALEEYLGCDYPLFFRDLNEAADILAQNRLILNAHKFLMNMDKSRFSIDYFVNSLANSQIYRNLPKPPKI